MKAERTDIYTPRSMKIFAVFATLLCLFIWIAPANPEWRSAWYRYLAQRRQSQNIQRMMDALEHDPEEGTPMLISSEGDVTGNPLPRGRRWVLVVDALSQCAIPLLRRWDDFAQWRHEPVIVITTSSAVVVQLFQRENHFHHLRFVSDPLIAHRPEWNVFMYPRLYLLDANGRLRWICKMPIATPHAIPDALLGGHQ